MACIGKSDVFISALLGVVVSRAVESHKNSAAPVAERVIISARDLVPVHPGNVQVIPAAAQVYAVPSVVVAHYSNAVDTDKVAEICNCHGISVADAPAVQQRTCNGLVGAFAYGAVLVLVVYNAVAQLFVDDRFFFKVIPALIYLSQPLRSRNIYLICRSHTCGTVFISVIGDKIDIIAVPSQL